MHGRGWHDHDAPHELQPEWAAGADAVLEAESSGSRTGMGARRVGARPTQTQQRRSRSVPPSKGQPKRAAKRAASKRSRAKAAPKGQRRI